LVIKPGSSPHDLVRSFFMGDPLLRDDPTYLDVVDPQHWHRLAADTREKANGMSSSELKKRMLEIAAEYDRLAEYTLTARASNANNRINSAAACGR
jgi:hypothetical protein